MLFLAVKARWIHCGDLIWNYIRGEQQGCQGMLSLKAPLLQGGDALLAEEGRKEGRTHPRAPNLVTPGMQVGGQGHSTGNVPVCCSGVTVPGMGNALYPSSTPGLLMACDSHCSSEDGLPPTLGLIKEWPQLSMWIFRLTQRAVGASSFFWLFSTSLSLPLLCLEKPKRPHQQAACLVSFI